MNRSADRRRGERSPQAGGVAISFEDPNPVQVIAELIEVSDRGFRAAHDSKLLAPGLEVAYARADAAGRARVIWTHVLDGRSVSGFLILG